MQSSAELTTDSLLQIVCHKMAHVAFRIPKIAKCGPCLLSLRCHKEAFFLRGRNERAVNLFIVEGGHESAAGHREQCPRGPWIARISTEDGKTRGTAARERIDSFDSGVGERASKDLEEGTGTSRAPRQGEPESCVSLS